MNPGLRRMRDLLLQQDFRSFEWIIVDGYYHVRRDCMLRMLEEMKQELVVRYLPPKPSPWAHLRPALCNALNTALIWAQGRTVVELDDCCSEMPTNWLQAHVTSNHKGFALSGSFETGQSIDPRRELFPEGGQIGPEHFYSSHRSYPLSKALEVNGYPEILDGEQGQNDIAMAFQLDRAGVKFVYDPRLAIKFDSSIHSLTQYSPDPAKRLWPREPWIVDPKTKEMADGTQHYANEWLALEIREGRHKDNGNNFTLSELRQIPAAHNFSVRKVQRALAPFQAAEVDWRDNQPVEDMPGGEFLLDRSDDVAIKNGPIKLSAISATGLQAVIANNREITRYVFASEVRTDIPSVEHKAIYLLPKTHGVVSLSRSAKIYPNGDGEPVTLAVGGDELRAASVASGEQSFAVGGFDRRVRVWDLANRTLIATTAQLSNSVTALAFLSDTRLIAATASGTVESLDPATGDILGVDKGFSEPITALSCHPGDAFYFAGSADGSLQMMRSVGGRSALPKAHEAKINCLHVSGCGTFGISGDAKGVAAIWYLPSCFLVQRIELSHQILAAHLAIERERAYLIDSTGTLLSWLINPRVKRGLYIEAIRKVMEEF